MLGTSAEEKVIVPERLVVCSCFVARVPPGLHGSKLVLWHCILLLYARPAGRATRKRACVLSVGLRVLCGGGYSAGRGPRAGFTDAGSSPNFDVLFWAHFPMWSRHGLSWRPVQFLTSNFPYHALSAHHLTVQMFPILTRISERSFKK